jgi:hypothetical protein
MLVIIVSVYVALAVAYTWPLARHLGHGIAHDPGDPLLNTWILWWSTQTIPLTDTWWNAPFFHPAPGVLAFSEHLLGLAPIAAPLIAITKLPLLGYNVALIATFVLSGLGAHFLGYTLTRRHDAALVAGIAFAFAPYRLAQVPHIQVLASYWAPLCLAALHRYDRGGGARWAAVAAGAWLLQSLSCGYYLFFLAVLIALWLAWFAVGRWPARRTINLAAAFGTAALLLVPVLHGYQSILQDTYGKSRAIGEIRMFSADVLGLLAAAQELMVWGWVRVVDRAESTLFPGLTIVVLAVVGVWSARPLATERAEPAWLWRTRVFLAAAFVLLVVATAVPIVYGPWRLTVGGLRLLSIGRGDKPLTLALLALGACALSLPAVRAAVRRRSPLLFYALAAIAMWMCALGPDPSVLGAQALYQAPYGWLMRLPGFGGLRVPARFWMMALACLSAIAALVIARFHGRTSRVAVVAATVGLLLDGWPAAFTVLPAPDLRPSPTGVAARLDLPVGDNDPLAMYQQTFDPRPLHNGYSGYFAPHYYAMSDLLAHHDDRILDALASSTPLGIVVDHAGDADGSIRRWIAARPGARLERDAGTWSSYKLAPSAAVPLPDRRGEPVPIKALDALPSPPHAPRVLDGSLVTRWSGGPQQQSAEMVIELERPTRVGQVVTDLGEYITDFPERLQIDVSGDGKTWHMVWLGETALHAYYGALRHPREVPLVFAIDAGEIKFIRLRQKGFGKHDWSIAELHVLR